MENFNQIVEYALAHTDEDKRIGSVLFDEFGKKENLNPVFITLKTKSILIRLQEQKKYMTRV